MTSLQLCVLGVGAQIPALPANLELSDSDYFVLFEFSTTG